VFQRHKKKSAYPTFGGFTHLTIGDRANSGCSASASKGVTPSLIFEGSHPIQAVGEDPHPNSGAVILSSMAAHEKRQVFCPTEQDRSLIYDGLEKDISQ